MRGWNTKQEISGKEIVGRSGSSISAKAEKGIYLRIAGAYFEQEDRLLRKTAKSKQPRMPQFYICTLHRYANAAFLGNFCGET